MSLAVLRIRALAGMEAPAVNVEVHLANGLPSMTIVAQMHQIKFAAWTASLLANALSIWADDRRLAKCRECTDR
jgi:hypothetical protein